MVRAVRGAGEQCPAQQATPERVQEREGRPKVERHEFPGIPSAPERAHAAREMRRDDERSEEHTSELQSLAYLVCRLLLEKKKTNDPTESRIDGSAHELPLT